MTPRRLPASLLAVLVLALTAGVRAEDPVIPATDKAALTEAVGKQVTVEGKIKSAAWSKTGKVMNIEFEGAETSKFKAAVFDKNKAKVDAAFEGDAAKFLTGKKVRVSGTIKLFKEAPEIVIDSEKQITVVKE